MALGRRLNVITIRDAIITLLETAGYATELNYGLSSNVTDVIDGDPYSMPVPDTMYPIVIVRVLDKREDFPVIGGNSEGRVTFEIFGLVRIMTGSDDSDDEAIKLADNIETVLRADRTIGSTCYLSYIPSTEYGTLINNQSTYVSACRITVECLARIEA